MTKIRIVAIIVLVVGCALGWVVWDSENNQNSKFKFPFIYGLDLNGGSHLVYKADVSKIDPKDVSSSMESLKNVVEKRINVFSVSEPVVQVEKSDLFSSDGTENRLVVELPSESNMEKAVAAIGRTPRLEFKIYKENSDLTINPTSTNGTTTALVDMNSLYEPTGLTGSQLKKANLAFDQVSNQPYILVDFNDEGKNLLSEITKKHKDEVMAIFLDGEPISAPVIRDEITTGSAQITGQFTPEEAKNLVRDLNFGALPVPIELIQTQTVGASLGEGALMQSVYAGIWGFILISLFLIIWYRLPGFVAVLALALYVILNLLVFKLLPVTLTSAGLAAFILSLGMAVDANILIFERTKEEMARGLSVNDALREGFHRAWLSIRDSNISSIITAVILYFFATSSLIKGFALVFLFGVLISMFTAISVSRTLLFAIGIKGEKPFTKFLFGNGFKKLLN
jgi:preprotein translocase subunit SecD